jgi:hypothetical protein
VFKEEKIMIRFVFIAFFLIALPPVSYAEELLLGTVETQKDGADLITVIQAPDRPSVFPEELVTIQSRIPGIDEIVESARGYVYATREGIFRVKITEGEPALGEEVVLLKEEFLNGSVSTDEDVWRRMGYKDLHERGFNKKKDHKVGAVCALAYMHAEGDEVEKNDRDAYVLFKYAATGFENPPPDCAAEYGMRLITGDMLNDPPQWDMDPDNGFYWVEYAAKKGSYLGMTFYATSLESLGDSDEAKKWFKKAIEIEPEKFKGAAQEVWDALRRR